MRFFLSPRVIRYKHTSMQININDCIIEFDVFKNFSRNEIIYGELVMQYYLHISNKTSVTWLINTFGNF